MTDPLIRILCVEDEPDIRTVAKVALEVVGGYAVEVCGGGTEALEVAPLFKPDLVLRDVMMPDIDGPSTLAVLRAVPGFAETPVVFMTAKAMPQEIDRYKELGALDVIAKPFDPMTLAERVQSTWDARHG